MATKKLLLTAGAAVLVAPLAPLAAQSSGTELCHRMPVSNEFSDPDGCDIGGGDEGRDPRWGWRSLPADDQGASDAGGAAPGAGSPE